ncbi:MAG: hypothetical protein GY849_24125 [Deltaproteobacteria bacterium]|nr:hypothetical protein [Deltaproteobacteria bacterium]
MNIERPITPRREMLNVKKLGERVGNHEIYRLPCYMTKKQKKSLNVRYWMFVFLFNVGRFPLAAGFDVGRSSLKTTPYGNIDL